MSLVADPAFGSCRFRIPKDGKRAIWQVTNACNYGCRYCIFASNSRVADDELDTDACLRVLSELASSGFTHLKLTGGEPFLRPDMTALVERAYGLGMTCDVSTNASRIGSDDAARLAAAGIETVHVSLDGHDVASHEAVRGRNTFAPTLVGIDLLVAAGVPVRIGCVVHAANDATLADVAALAERLGAASVVFSRMEPVGRMRDRPSLLSRLTDDGIRDAVESAARGVAIAVSHNLDAEDGSGCSACPGGDRFAFVDHLGRVSPCTWVSEHRPEFVAEVTLASSSFAELLASERPAKYRTEATATFASGFDRCPMSEPHRLVAPFARFGREAPTYGFATEGLAYVDDVVLPGDLVATVCGSGDHVIAACAAGASRVVGFDVNVNAVHWTMLKLAALSTLSLSAFMEFLSPGPFALDRATLDALVLPYDTRAFFLSGLEASGSGESYRSGPGFVSARSVGTPCHVPYLCGEARYLAARAAVATVDPTLLVADVTDFLRGADAESFDAVLLSNLAEHSHGMFPGRGHVAAFRDGVAMRAARLLRPGGRVVSYVFDATDRRSSSARTPYGDPTARAAAYRDLDGYASCERSYPTSLTGVPTDVVDSTLVIGDTRVPDLSQSSPSYGARAADYACFSLYEDAPGLVGSYLLSKVPAGSRVIDVGCGNGKYLGALTVPARLAVGVDASAAHASRAKDGTGTDVVVADAVAMPFAAGSFDVAVACWMLGTVPEPRRTAALAEIVRCVRPGGMVLLVENDEGGDFEDVRGRVDDPALRTRTYNEWLLSRGFVADARMATRFGFPDLESARDTFGRIWGTKVRSRVRSATMSHDVVAFAYAVPYERNAP